jgi:hypothetical protein
VLAYRVIVLWLSWDPYHFAQVVTLLSICIVSAETFMWGVRTYSRRKADAALQWALLNAKLARLESRLQ